MTGTRPEALTVSINMNIKDTVNEQNEFKHKNYEKWPTPKSGLHWYPVIELNLVKMQSSRFFILVHCSFVSWSCPRRWKKPWVIIVWKLSKKEGKNRFDNWWIIKRIIFSDSKLPIIIGVPIILFFFSWEFCLF